VVPVTTLYQSVLGDRFTTLPPALQRFHACEGARAQGYLRVQRGRRLIARLAGWIMGLPPAGERLTTSLQVTTENGREVWTRRFSNSRRAMITRQWRDGASLVESAGPCRTYFELASEPDGMRFVQQRCTLLGLPLPSALAPQAQARAWSSDSEGWEMEVRISLPVVGLLVVYAGRFIPE
jgi:hypothetical protein